MAPGSVAMIPKSSQKIREIAKSANKHSKSVAIVR